MKKVERIVLKGQNYVAPQTESVAIKNQGVLCGSPAAMRCGNLSGYGKGTGF